MTRRTLVCVCLLGALADAHAILKSSVPRPKQILRGPDVAITLTFNSRIDGKRSRIAVASTDAAERPLSIADQSSPEVMRAVAKGLKSGSYTVRWQVLASDGHISRGEIPFEVQ